MQSASPAIVLDKKTHVYTCEGRRLASVGSLVKRVTPQFDAHFNAQRVAEREGKTKDQVLVEWERNRDAACDTGIQLHEFIDRVLSGRPPEEKQQGEAVPPKCRQWLAWWEKAEESLSPVETEHIVGSLELGIAGTQDMLAESSKTEKLHVFDWKNNKAMRDRNDYGKTLLPPFDDLPDCELTRYSLQVSLYRLLVELEMCEEIGESWIVHVTDDFAKPYKAFDLRRRAEDWVRGLKL